ncbi:MAG: hypothetical protein H0X36_14380, partial [Sphingomonadaceae bacterium]|nr:hypothetical protein [Sphingomonadaceae bacterium]
GGAGLSFTTANATGGSAILTTAGALSVDRSQASADAAFTSSGGGVTLGASNVAGGALGVTAAGTATFNGVATGATMAIRSSDIAIAPTAQLGAQGTTSQLSFTSTNSGQTFIGGAATGSGGYRLGDAELQRAFANGISIAAVPGQQGASVTPNATPGVVLDTLTLTAAQNGQTGATAANIGASGTLRIQTPGVLRVVGAVKLNNANSGNRFELAADTAIEAQPTGSIALNGASGLIGTLALNSADVIASSAQALSDVAAAANLKAASDRLGINDGAVNDEGYFGAGGIIVTIGNSLYIQNSGVSAPAGTSDFTGRRGFTVGDGGFTVVAAGTNRVKIAINGRQVSTTATGGFVTGVDLIPRVVIRTSTGQATGQATSAFDPLSTINGCSILNPDSCGVHFDDPGKVARDVIENEVEQMSIGQLLPVALVELKDFEGFADQPLIDEPVTGAGNDDLYAIDDSQVCDAKRKDPPCK